MSEANKQILEKLNAAISKLDFDAALELCTEDTEWTFEGDKTLKGKKAVRQWMETDYREPPEFKLHRTVAEGNYLVAIGEIMVKDHQGKPLLHNYADVWRFRDGLMAELHAFVVKAL